MATYLLYSAKSTKKQTRILAVEDPTSLGTEHNKLNRLPSYRERGIVQATGFAFLL